MDAMGREIDWDEARRLILEGTLKSPGSWVVERTQWGPWALYRPSVLDPSHAFHAVLCPFCRFAVRVPCKNMVRVRHAPRSSTEPESFSCLWTEDHSQTATQAMEEHFHEFHDTESEVACEREGWTFRPHRHVRCARLGRWECDHCGVFSVPVLTDGSVHFFRQMRARHRVSCDSGSGHLLRLLATNTCPEDALDRLWNSQCQ